MLVAEIYRQSQAIKFLFMIGPACELQCLQMTVCVRIIETQPTASISLLLLLTAAKDWIAVDIEMFFKLWYKWCYKHCLWTLIFYVSHYDPCPMYVGAWEALSHYYLIIFIVSTFIIIFMITLHLCHQVAWYNYSFFH